MRLFILSLLFLSTITQAKLVDHLKVQYAGEIGLLSFGLGKNFSPTYSLEVFYGHVPKSIAGNEIQTYAVKNNFKHYDFTMFSGKFNFYSGINVYHVVGLKYQTSRLANYPRNYYRMSSIRGLFYLGLEAEVYEKEHKAYFEAGINDIWLINYFNNTDVINPSDYVSLALGWNYQFW